MSETKQLTPQQLGALIGKTVQVDATWSFYNGRRGVMRSIGANPDMAYVVFEFNAEGRPSVTDSISTSALRPVLRTPLEVMDEEWYALFGEIFVIARDQENEFVTFRYPDETEPYLSIWNDGEIGCDEMSNYADLIDYLRSISVDCNGWIQQGLAVHAQPDNLNQP